MLRAAARPGVVELLFNSTTRSWIEAYLATRPPQLQRTDPRQQ
jgi:hypothetical protein